MKRLPTTIPSCRVCPWHSFVESSGPDGYTEFERECLIEDRDIHVHDHFEDSFPEWCPLADDGGGQTA